ncbi:MAG: M42 family metallopeptidase [Thermoanaerobacteraceae bacterium]|nr:M42 family metallopeptidase [Thermoanaerobacteraceae bacterium]
MLLKQLCDAFGVSGAEAEVRDIIRQELCTIGKTKTDPLGNLFVEKTAKYDKPTLMLCAHMDEVGFMIKHIDNNGFLRFDKIGGIDDRILVSKNVVIGPNKIRGVIGAKAIHLQEPKERETPLRSKELYIDIGATSKEDAEKHVKIGDYAVFDTEFRSIDNIIMGKALDDRIGCYVVSEVLKKSYDVPITAAFTVQEEIGLRGSAVAAYAVNPDFAIVVETTFASDVPDTEEESYCTTLSEGPAITFMDMTYIAEKALINWVTDIAKQYNIPYQYKRTAFGGTDGGRIYTTRKGIPTVIFSVPCRYIHSPVALANIEDINHTISLVEKIILHIKEKPTIKSKVGFE